MKRKQHAPSRLAEADVADIVQYTPFQRMTRRCLRYGVRRISTPSVVTIMEAAAQYAHELYADAHHIGVHSSKNKSLMLRHLMGAVRAKGSSIVGMVDDEATSDDSSSEDE